MLPGGGTPLFSSVINQQTPVPMSDHDPIAIVLLVEAFTTLRELIKSAPAMLAAYMGGKGKTSQAGDAGEEEVRKSS